MPPRPLSTLSRNKPHPVWSALQDVSAPMSCRVVQDGVLALQDCQRLVWIAKCLSVIGYRAAVCSATIHDIASTIPALLVPLLRAREAVRAALEQALDVPLLIEFTGLVSWRPGSSIGWHYDANRPYLLQRSHSAVCYLNAAANDFAGGTFRFKDGAPEAVKPAAGRLVAYSAQDVHSVDPVAAGERFTLTLWFTEDPQHCEDMRLLAQLAGNPGPQIGLPASMWRLPDGTDLRFCRLGMAGLALVWRGQVLSSTDALAPAEPGDDFLPAPFQVALNPVEQLAWRRLQAAGQLPAPGAAELSGDGLKQSKAVVLDGVQFECLQAAVLALQHFLQQRSGCGGSRERVCCAHVYGGSVAPAPQPTCSWLRCCKLVHGACAELPAADLQQAASACTAALAAERDMFDVLLPRWIQAGALFCEGEEPAVNSA